MTRSIIRLGRSIIRWLEDLYDGLGARRRTGDGVPSLPPTFARNCTNFARLVRNEVSDFESPSCGRKFGGSRSTGACADFRAECDVPHIAKLPADG